MLKLETSEATFMIDMTNQQHFMFKCACKRKEGIHSGSHYKNGSDKGWFSRKNYERTSLPRKYPHTFYLNENIFLDTLDEHRESKGQSTLVIVCDDCGREFPFSQESYLGLREKMIIEDTKRLIEKSK